MSSIHYKLKSTLQYKTLTFDGLHISVDDLKRVICEKENIKSESFDLILTNAHTKRQYNSDDLVPRNSSVLVQRIPRENALKLPKVQDTSTSGIVVRNVSTQQDQVGYIQSEEFLKMTEEQRLAHVKEVSYQKYLPSNYQKKPSPIMSGPPPPTYVCNRCSQPGHWFKNCPLLATRRTTGIPMEELMETTKDDPLALLHPSGKFVVPIMHYNARQQRKQETVPGTESNTDDNGANAKIREVPPELACPLCKNLLREAVLATCCGDSFCAECAQQLVLDDKNGECPGAGCNQKITSDSLVPNNKMRQAVQKFLSSAENSTQIPAHIAGANKPDLSNTNSLLHKLLPDLVQTNSAPVTMSRFLPQPQQQLRQQPSTSTTVEAQQPTQPPPTTQAVQITTSSISIPSSTQPSFTTTAINFVVPPPQTQISVDFSVPPPVITSVTSAANYQGPTVTPVFNTAGNGVDACSLSTNFLIPPPNLSAPPPPISMQFPPPIPHMMPSTTSTSSVPNDALTVSVPPVDLNQAPGASSSSSSDTPSSSSSHDSDANSSKESIEKSNELNNAWQTLLNRTEEHSMSRTFQNLHTSVPSLPAVKDLPEVGNIVSAQGISDAWESFIKNKYEKKRTDREHRENYHDGRSKMGNSKRNVSRGDHRRHSSRDRVETHRRQSHDSRDKNHKFRGRGESRERRNGGAERDYNDHRNNHADSRERGAKHRERSGRGDSRERKTRERVGDNNSLRHPDRRNYDRNDDTRRPNRTEVEYRIKSNIGNHDKKSGERAGSHDSVDSAKFSGTIELYEDSHAKTEKDGSKQKSEVEIKDRKDSESDQEEDEIERIIRETHKIKQSLSKTNATSRKEYQSEDEKIDVKPESNSVIMEEIGEAAPLNESNVKVSPIVEEVKINEKKEVSEGDIKRKGDRSEKSKDKKKDEKIEIKISINRKGRVDPEGHNKKKESNNGESKKGKQDNGEKLLDDNETKKEQQHNDVKLKDELSSKTSEKKKDKSKKDSKKKKKEKAGDRKERKEKKKKKKKDKEERRRNKEEKKEKKRKHHTTDSVAILDKPLKDVLSRDKEHLEDVKAGEEIREHAEKENKKARKDKEGGRSDENRKVEKRSYKDEEKIEVEGKPKKRHRQII